MQTDTKDPTELPHDQRISADESLTSVLRGLSQEGFGGSFRPAPEPVEGLPAVVCSTCRQSCPAPDLRVDRERRLEGASDPDDMVLLVAATCPACGAQGTIALAYGPEASIEDTEIVQALHQPDEPEGPSESDGDAPQSDPGGDSDPDANEGFEAPR